MLSEVRGFMRRNGFAVVLCHAVELYLGTLLRALPGLEGFWLRGLLYRALFKAADKNLYIYPGVRIIFSWRIQAGRRVAINSGTYMDGRGGISIGSDVMIGPNCVIVSVAHGTADVERPMWTQELRYAPVSIGDDVWIGASVSVLPGITIGRGAVIGAGAVVTHSIPDWAVAAGQPARVIRLRGREDAPRAGAEPRDSW